MANEMLVEDVASKGKRSIEYIDISSDEEETPFRKFVKFFIWNFFQTLIQHILILKKVLKHFEKRKPIFMEELFQKLVKEIDAELKPTNNVIN